MPIIFHDGARHRILQNEMRTSKQKVTLYLNENSNIIILSNFERLLEKFNKQFGGLRFLLRTRLDLLHFDIIFSMHKNRAVARFFEKIS